jgi:hypothetical protein
VITALGEKQFEEHTHGRIVVDDHYVRFTVEMQARHAVRLSNAGASAGKMSPDWRKREF